MKSDLDTSDRLRGFDNITATHVGNGWLALAVAAPADATTMMTIIKRGEYDSDQEFGMEVVQWCRKHSGRGYPRNAATCAKEADAMRHAVELVS